MRRLDTYIHREDFFSLSRLNRHGLLLHLSPFGVLIVKKLKKYSWYSKRILL